MSKSHQGHVARKRFGQNFLNDDYVIGRIVDVIGPKAQDNLVEIGPGLGALTEPVCERVEKLTVIELDRDLAKRLRHHPFHQDKLTVIEQDALSVDFSQLPRAYSETPKLRVFGNLPYNISTPIMFHLFKFCDSIQDMHFMLQKEVVDRLAAAPGSKHFGRLSVMAQYYCQITPALDVPPGAFVPPPKVNSAVVRLTPHATPPIAVDDVEMLAQVCAQAFNQRRKTIRNSLSQLLTSEQIESVNINPGIRAEKLTLTEFAALANLVSANPPIENE